MVMKLMELIKKALKSLTICGAIIAFTAKSSFGGVFTLNACIDYARQNSPKAIAAKKAYKARMFRHDAFRAGFLPQISLSGTTPGLSRSIIPITQNDGSKLFKKQSQLYSSAFLSLSQKIPFTGAEINLSSGMERIDLLSDNNSFYWAATPVQISLTQPIFKQNYMKWDRDVEDLQSRASDNIFAEDMEQIGMDVARKFFDFYISKMRIENIANNVAINDTLFRVAQGRYKIGKIAENELLQSELAMLNTHNEFETAKIDAMQIEEEFKKLIGVSISDSLDVNPPLTIPIFKPNPDLALEYAYNNLSEFVQYKVQELQADRTLDEAKTSSGLAAEITASYGLNQSAGTVPSAYKNLLDQERFNVTLSIPLFQWGKSSYEIGAALEERDRTLENIKINKENLKTELKFQIKKFELLTEQVRLSAKADTIAQRRFEVSKNRYILGTIDVNTLLIAQNEKNSAFTSYLSTLSNFWAAYYNIRKMTIFDFEKNVPIRYSL